MLEAPDLTVVGISDAGDCSCSSIINSGNTRIGSGMAVETAAAAAVVEMKKLQQERQR